MRTFAQKQNQPQKPVSSSLARFNAAKPWPNHREHPILHLQHALGNQTVQQILQTHAEEPEAKSTAAASPRVGHDFSWIPAHSPASGAIQTKLAVNRPGDIYEQEADRISEQVMRMPEPEGQHACSSGRLKGQTEQAPAREHESVQTKRVRAGDAGQVAAPSIVHEVLAAPDQSLNPATRSFMEPRFGHDFSRVRVHADARAAESARTLNARAYTVGRDVAFGAGQYAPQTSEGQRLLAHELAHVVQQGRGAVALQRQPQQGGAEELARDLLEISHELRGIGDRIDEGLEDLEIFRHELFLAGKKMPKVGDRIQKATVADFVEAAIETSRTLAPFLPPGKRARTSVAKGLTIHTFRQQLEAEDARLSHRVTPSVGQPHRTGIVKASTTGRQTASI
jgi:Domain of unknown function (DUF4157)